MVTRYKEHGIGLTGYLRGEFAFVLYDSQRHLLFAARDRFGIKPFYYTISDGRLLIASEMKAFTALGWNPEWDIESVVQMGDSNDDRTVFKGVFKAS
jgi:asparagine synthase (glutamine-hydrolysing)